MKTARTVTHTTYGGLVPHVHLAFWPITDEHRTFAQLVTEAAGLLEAMLADAALVALGDTTWETRDDVAWPDHDGALLLVARTPAAPLDFVMSRADGPGRRATGGFA